MGVDIDSRKDCNYDLLLSKESQIPKLYIFNDVRPIKITVCRRNEKGGTQPRGHSAAPGQNTVCTYVSLFVVN